jgi:hypothetical protein
LSVAGFGTSTWGTNTQVIGTGKPVNNLGQRNRMLVDLNVLSVKDNYFLTHANVALSQPTECNADSGNMAVVRTPVNGEDYVGYGMNLGGDPYCREGNSFVRVDTPAFKTWASSVKGTLAAWI